MRPVSDIVSLTPNYGCPRAQVFAWRAADAWGWQPESLRRSYYYAGASSPVPTPSDQMIGQLSIFSTL